MTDRYRILKRETDVKNETQRSSETTQIRKVKQINKQKKAASSFKSSTRVAVIDFIIHLNSNTLKKLLQKWFFYALQKAVSIMGILFIENTTAQMDIVYVCIQYYLFVYLFITF